MLTSLTRPTGGLGSWAATSALVATILLIGYLPKEPPLFDELTARAQLRPFNPLAICDH